MEHNKKDIGTLFQKKLQQKDIKLNSSAWKKIETSLIKRKRKRQIRFWLFGIGILLVISSVLIFNFPFSEKKQVDNTNNPVATPILPSSQKENKNEKIVELNKTSLNKEMVTKSIDTTFQDTAKTNKKTSKKGNTSKKKFSKSNFNNFEKKTVYKYYNSKDSTIIETTNKALIDSLIKIEKAEKIHDSIK